MGTRFELVLSAVPGGPEGASLRAAGEGAIDEIETCHRRLNRFAPDSLVSHLNRGLERPLALDLETFTLFADALAVWQASSGAFDITIAPELVGQGAAESAVPVARARSGVSRSIDLDFARRTIWFGGDAVSIDLGGIAKGHALDCAAARLRDASVSSALLHGGTSSVLAIGRPPGQPGWRVALGRSRHAATVVLDDAALSVSDPASQLAGTGRLHIVDPRSTEPTRLAGAAPVAVTGASARLADAWSTALAVLGEVPATFPHGYQARFIDRDGPERPEPLRQDLWRLTGGPAHADAAR